MEVKIRPLQIEDYSGLKEAMSAAYEGTGAVWREQSIKKLIDIFPDGQICVEVDGIVAACALSIIVQYRLFGDDHTYEEITGYYSFDTHSNSGNVLYGIEVFVHPDFRGLRLARRLYDARKELCEQRNLKEIKVGGRLPNYHKHSNLTPKEYIEKVRQKEIFDPVLSFQLANDFHPVKVLPHYLKGDNESREFAALLEWSNIYYSPTKSTVNETVIRLGLVQWQMRPFATVDKFMEQVEFFVDALSGYKSDFVLFPEFFNSPLLAAYNHLDTHDSMRALALKTPGILNKISELAIAYNVNIIVGSMPVIENEKLYNVSFLCHRSGKRDEYRKIHITPNETKYYGITGGDKIAAINTDCGKIGILICYDVEFPELSRLLALDGMKILFVPYLTDTQNAYTRVRHCAMARAIENECYVAIAGCVGNLPGVNNMDIQFGQAAVFTPSDFAFPTNAIKAEATPNTEMTLIVDVDLNLLKELHHFGSVKVIKDRRTDLYEVKRLPKSIEE
mgnify:CR=1 FL=1